MAAHQHARLALRRSGGLAGLTMEGVLDTRQLPEQEAEAVLGALDHTDLEALSTTEAPATGAADRFQYELTVERGETKQVASFSEARMPAELAPVLRAIMQKAKPAPLG